MEKYNNIKAESDKILIIIPKQYKGGVFNFYNNLLPSLTENYYPYFIDITYNNKFINLLYHLHKIFITLKSQKFNKIVINPSLLINSIFRDSLIASISYLLKIKVIVFWRGWNFDNEKYLKFPYSMISNKLLKANHCITLFSSVESSLIKLGYLGGFSRLTTIVSDNAFNTKLKKIIILI